MLDFLPPSLVVRVVYLLYFSIGVRRPGLCDRRYGHWIDGSMGCGFSGVGSIISRVGLFNTFGGELIGCDFGITVDTPLIRRYLHDRRAAVWRVILRVGFNVNMT